MFYVCLTIFAAAIVAVDQWTKALAAAQLTDCVDVIIPGWLELRYLLNDGMALSMFRGGRWVFVARSDGKNVLFVVIKDSRKKNWSRLTVTGPGWQRTCFPL